MEHNLDETIAKHVLNQIVNTIVVEQIDSLKIKAQAGANSLNSENPSKRRKLDESSNIAKVDIEKCRKEFDPLGEHYTWCPWLRRTASIIPHGCYDENNEPNLATRAVCQWNFELIQRKLLTVERKQQHYYSDDDVNFSKNNVILATTLTSERSLYEKVKSAQALLANCTSKLNDNKAE